MHEARLGRLFGCHTARVRLEAAFFEFGVVLRYEARIFFGRFDLLGGVGGDLVAGLGVFAHYVPKMFFFFHFVLFVFEAQFLLFAFLRFEAIGFFALFGS